MAAYLIRRLWQMVPTLIGVVLLVFFLFKYFGGDPAEILGGLNATPEQILAIRQTLGLDQSVWVQLGIYLKSIVSFDWGKSWATNEAVSNLFATRLPATLTVIGPPTVTGVSPAAGTVLGGASVVVTGTNFSTTLADNSVTFGTSTATVTAATATQLTVTTPAGSAGSVDVSVQVVSQSGMLANAYTYVEPTVAAAVSPCIAV